MIVLLQPYDFKSTRQENNTKEVGREVHKVVPDVNVPVLLTIIIEE